MKLLLRYVAGWHNYAVLCVIEKLQFHKISIPLTEDIYALDPRHPAWNFHSMGGGGGGSACHTPHPLEFP